MTRLTPYRLAAIAALVIALLAGPAMAQSPTADSPTADSTTDGTVGDVDTPGSQTDDDRAFMDLVRAIDVLPDRQAMEARFPDAMERLIAVAKDGQATTFERWRATSLLGNFVEPQAQAALQELSTDAAEARIRAMAYYVLGAAFLEDGDDQLLAHLENGLDDESSRVRADVVRSLGWTEHEQAPQLLATIADDDQDQHLAPIAERALQRLR